MSESFIKKAIFLVLFTILAIVWGHNIYQMIPAGSGEYYKKVESNTHEKELEFSSEIGKRQLSVIGYSGDPFKPFFTRKIAEPITSITKIDVRENINLLDIHYLGLIKNKASKYAIIEMAGNITEIIRIGDEINDIKILDFDEDSLKYRYEGKIHKIAIGK